MSGAGALFGVLAIDKPAGLTSRDVVNRIQKLTDPVKVGHTGTLDPLATGVLLVAVGPATRLVEFAHLQRKCYEADFVLGQSSPTLDVEGRVTSLPDTPAVDLPDWSRAMQGWIGAIVQTPPRHSAVHVQGQRAYDLARRGIAFDVPSRVVQVYSLEVIGFHYPLVTMAIQCSTGTFVRSLGSDIARSLHSDAVMSRLVRTRIGSTTVDGCEALEQLTDRQAIQRHLRSPLVLLERLPRVVLDDEQCRQIRNGIALNRLQAASVMPPILETGQGVATTDEDLAKLPIAAVDVSGHLVAVLQRASDVLRSCRVFH
ncbi:MAG: tRNA pseudouridine(55) synthase TruB [Pirellulaceae bacterium]|nr:tRNA pseudouridine(55) synthase TruB [Pirellulaceae bacterium]